MILLMLNRFLDLRVKQKDSMDSWVGRTDGADRDYSILKHAWCEIKTISTGKDSVTISSLNQLEVDYDGVFSDCYCVDESSIVRISMCFLDL